MEKRLASILMILALVVTLIPTQAHASTKVRATQTQTQKNTVTNVKLASSTKLLEDYVRNKYVLKKGRASSVNQTQAGARGKRLSGNDLVVYKELRTYIEDIADGSRSSAVIELPMSKLTKGKTSFSADELGVSTLLNGNRIDSTARERFLDQYEIDYGKVLTALLTDLPYNLYWFDKVRGLNTARKSSMKVTYEDGDQTGGHFKTHLHFLFGKIL